MGEHTSTFTSSLSLRLLTKPLFMPHFLSPVPLSILPQQIQLWSILLRGLMKLNDAFSEVYHNLLKAMATLILHILCYKWTWTLLLFNHQFHIFDDALVLFYICKVWDGWIGGYHFIYFTLFPSPVLRVWRGSSFPKFYMKSRLFWRDSVNHSF